jgi:hypothetical protein
MVERSSVSAPLSAGADCHRVIPRAGIQTMPVAARLKCATAVRILGLQRPPQNNPAGTACPNITHSPGAVAKTWRNSKNNNLPHKTVTRRLSGFTSDFLPPPTALSRCGQYSDRSGSWSACRCNYEISFWTETLPANSDFMVELTTWQMGLGLSERSSLCRRIFDVAMTRLR